MRVIRLLLLLLATGAASYWYAQKYELQRLQPAQETPDAAPTLTTTPETTPAPQPYREHIVVAGETLYSISKQYSLQWSTVADYNQLAENSVIKPGMVLKIPLNEKGELTRIDHVATPSDTDKERITQLLKQGIDRWYADPIQVVHRTAPVEYHLKNDDRYTIISLDYGAAAAMIEVIHDDRTLLVTLTQFEAGKGNAWYITQVETR